MDSNLQAGDKLLSAWLNLTSTLWNTRLVETLTYNETHVLGILLRKQASEGEPMTATDLIHRTHLLKSQMNKVVSTLESNGYIVRTKNEADRRMAFIHLTAEGREAYLREHQRIDAIVSKLIDRIGEERALRVSTDIQAIVSAIDDILKDEKA